MSDGKKDYKALAAEVAANVAKMAKQAEGEGLGQERIAEVLEGFDTVDLEVPDQNDPFFQNESSPVGDENPALVTPVAEVKTVPSKPVRSVGRGIRGVFDED